ncbi:MAG: hypothetical protein ABFD79_05000 [Phycisphaerales bacterium]
MKIHPWTMILTMFAGWVNQHQQDVIEYLKAENAVLKEKLGKKRLILSDEQRRRLAVLAKRIGVRYKYIQLIKLCYHYTV